MVALIIYVTRNKGVGETPGAVRFVVSMDSHDDCRRFIDSNRSLLDESLGRGEWMFSSKPMSSPIQAELELGKMYVENKDCTPIGDKCSDCHVDVDIEGNCLCGNN